MKEVNIMYGNNENLEEVKPLEKYGRDITASVLDNKVDSSYWT